MVSREGMKKTLVHGEDHMGNVSFLVCTLWQAADEDKGSVSGRLGVETRYVNVKFVLDA